MDCAFVEGNEREWIQFVYRKEHRYLLPANLSGICLPDMGTEAVCAR